MMIVVLACHALGTNYLLERDAGGLAAAADLRPGGLYVRPAAVGLNVAQASGIGRMQRRQVNGVGDGEHSLGRWPDDRPGAGAKRRGGMPTARRWSFRSSAAAGPGGSSPPMSMRPPAACWRWASSRASTSPCGPPTCPSGCCCSSPRPGSARCWSTSTRPIGPFELQYVLKQSDAVALFLVDQFKSSDYFAMLAEVCPEIAAAQATAGSAVRKYPRAAERRGAQGHAAGRAADLGRRWSSAAAAFTPRELDDIGGTLHRRASRSTSSTRPARPAFPRRRRSATATCCSTPIYIGELPDAHRATTASAFPVPFYHCFGCVLGTLACAVYGTTMIVPAEYFQADADARRHRAGAGDGALRRADDVHRPASGPVVRRAARSTSLRTGIMAGSPCPIEVMRQVIDKLGATRADDRLRPDRGLAGHHANADRRPDRAARRNRRPAAARRRGEDRRSGHRRRRCPTTSRASCAPAATS